MSDLPSYQASCALNKVLKKILVLYIAIMASLQTIIITTLAWLIKITASEVCQRIYL